jgi:hypothetical protein
MYEMIYHLCFGFDFLGDDEDAEGEQAEDDELLEHLRDELGRQFEPVERLRRQ